jgi:hypothetical protein
LGCAHRFAPPPARSPRHSSCCSSHRPQQTPQSKLSSPPRSPPSGSEHQPRSRSPSRSPPAGRSPSTHRHQPRLPQRPRVRHKRRRPRNLPPSPATGLRPSWLPDQLAHGPRPSIRGVRDRQRTLQRASQGHPTRRPTTRKPSRHPRLRRSPNPRRRRSPHLRTPHPRTTNPRRKPPIQRPARTNRPRCSRRINHKPPNNPRPQWHHLLRNLIHTRPYPEPDIHFGTLARLWPAYDCSGATSFVLYAAGLMGPEALDSTGLENYGRPGPGRPSESGREGERTHSNRGLAAGRAAALRPPLHQLAGSQPTRRRAGTRRPLGRSSEAHR